MCCPGVFLCSSGLALVLTAGVAVGVAVAKVSMLTSVTGATSRFCAAVCCWSGVLACARGVVAGAFGWSGAIADSLGCVCEISELDVQEDAEGAGAKLGGGARVGAGAEEKVVELFVRACACAFGVRTPLSEDGGAEAGWGRPNVDWPALVLAYGLRCVPACAFASECVCESGCAVDIQRGTPTGWSKVSMVCSAC
eukprot:6186738-Pleurochrysis_carterae.AAC.2